MNKEIIIDGVDVSDWADEEVRYKFEKHSSKAIRQIAFDLYKQLKQKEQEYEELRQYHNKCCEEFENEKQNLIDKYNQFSKDFFIGKYCKKEYCDLLKAKEQECEELKEDIERWKSNFNGKVSAIEELLQQLDQLKAKEQALDEIEKYLDAQQKYFDGEDYHNLLDIINKVKEE